MEDARKLDFVGEVLCPMKANFNEGYQAMAKEFKKRTGANLYSYVPTVCGGDATQPEAQELERELEAIDPERFPDVVASFGFGDYFHSAFRNKMLGKGYFDRLSCGSPSVAFAGTGIEDPDGELNIYAAYPMVFLIDKRKLGSLPVPRTLADLLDPVYSGNITMSGSHGRPNTTVLLHIYKEFGEDGVRRFESNVKQAIHPSQMAKLAGSASSEGTAVYTIMNFFARAKGESEYTELIWPEDGAPFDPAFILIKNGTSEKYKMIIDYVVSEFGQVFADNGFPAVYPREGNKLKDGEKLKWIGWDFLKNNKIEEICDELSARFQKFIEI